MKQFLSKYWERIVWLSVILAILLVFKTCNDKNGQQIEAIRTESAKLEQQHKADSIAFAIERSRWQDSIYRADINSDLQVKVIKETEKKLQATQSTISRLTSIIQGERISFVDSSDAVMVSKAYAAACDSLPAEIDKQNMVIGQLQDDNTKLVELMNYEVVYRDSLIEVGKEYIDSLRADYRRQKSLTDQAVKAGKPRGRLLGGIGLIGNEINPLSGTKINLAYQSKKGKQYQVGGLLMKGGVYYEATVLITLIK